MDTPTLLPPGGVRRPVGHGTLGAPHVGARSHASHRPRLSPAVPQKDWSSLGKRELHGDCDPSLRAEQGHVHGYGHGHVISGLWCLQPR